VVALVQPLADKRNVGIRAAYQHQPAQHVFADALRLRQVLLNVVSNAIKYNQPHGQVVIDVRSNHHQVEIDIVDTGPGMSKEQLAALFQPFNRLGREHSDVEGTGIGLNITRELMRLMGGTIAVRSEAGQGSTFTLTLPQAMAIEAPSEAESAMTTG
jgi:signal transduction histidine kinase